MKYKNSILILRTLKGYRLAYIDDVDELFWVLVEGTFHQYEEKKLSLEDLNTYFGRSQVYLQKDLAWHDAVMLYRQKQNEGVRFGKNGIQYVEGYEKVDF